MHMVVMSSYLDQVLLHGIDIPLYLLDHLAVPPYHQLTESVID